MRSKYLFIPLFAIILFSCRSVPKDITYFSDLDAQSLKEQTDDFYKYEPTIKNNDQLLITVSSPIMDQTQVTQFNLPMNTYLATGETIAASSPAIQTYTVDKEGYINFPVLGALKIAGLSRSEAVKLLRERVSAHLQDPIINLQIISFKVTVLGEVMQPGLVEVTDERISIFDALGAVGDMNIHGNRKNVKLIRDVNGQREIAVLDLTKADIFRSPYYYLQQNDVLYVEPNDARKKESKVGSADSNQLQTMSIVITALSVLTSAIVTISNLKK